MTHVDELDRDILSASLPGTWLLQSRIDVTATGERRIEPSLGEDPIALLIYDRAGHFAVQLMKRDRSGVGAESGYDAYFGTYIVDDARETVTQHLLGALSPEHVGATLMREVEVRGDSLSIRLQASHSDGTAVTRTLMWRRVG